MYQVRPENIGSFIDDHSIRFPRFQRKQTWKADKNIKLAISVFKPLGRKKSAVPSMVYEPRFRALNRLGTSSAPLSS